ncbi:MAG: FeoA family protein [Anaerolineae bacterium]
MESTKITHNGVRLSTVPTNEVVRVQKLEGGHSFLSRVASLGFTPGTRLKVIQNYGHGPLIVYLRDTRVALGRGEAEKIWVERVTGEQDG